jgi:hypothetical protein
MKELKEQIAILLQEDTTLLAMLPANPPWSDEDGTALAKWSIIPDDRYTKQLKPFIQVAAGPDTRVGLHLREAFFYIRCYNTYDKTYVEIDDILSRVKVLLHGHRFSFVDSTSIDTLYENTGAGLVDQAWNLRFRESRYRLLIV